MDAQERLLEVPTDDDENVGYLPKKKVKKKKSKEERSADRKVVFWTLLIVFAITIFFWLWPKVKNFRLGLPSFDRGVMEGEEKPKNEWKNYVEYKL